MHTGGNRRRGKPRSRILYWFRTPPGVRVGRSALDEEAIRLIEEHNPDVEFDWTRILKGQDETAPSAPFQQKERRARERSPREYVPPAAARPAPAVPHEPARPTMNELEQDANHNGGAVEIDPSRSSTPTVAEAKLGAEGLARLRARHAAVLARISEGIADPVRRDELKAQAERLNPDTWVTREEVTAGVESYEAVFETIRAAVGRRRKRRRPRRPRPDQTDHRGGAPDRADEADEDDGEAEERTPDGDAG